MYIAFTLKKRLSGKHVSPHQISIAHRKQYLKILKSFKSKKWVWFHVEYSLYGDRHCYRTFMSRLVIAEICFATCVYMLNLVLDSAITLKGNTKSITNKICNFVLFLWNVKLYTMFFPVILWKHCKHCRFKSLQNENAQLRQQKTFQPPSGGMDDSQLVQELNHKNKQVEIMHSQLKDYAENLDKQKTRAELLAKENYQLQQQLQYGNRPPPIPSRPPADMVMIWHDYLWHRHLYYLF